MPDPQDFTALQKEVGQLRTDVETLDASIKELVNAWRAAGLFVSFVKWVAGVMTALLAAYVAWTKFKGVQ